MHTMSFEMTVQKHMQNNSCVCFLPPYLFPVDTCRDLKTENNNIDSEISFSESVTYKELPGTWSKQIKDRVHVCILLLNFYF